MSEIKIFCLPNAGGTATMYARWKTMLHPSIQLCMLEPAGRGRRFHAPLYHDIEEAIEDLYHQIEPLLEGSPFAFFGHSMGALLCYELINMIWRTCGLFPLHAFFSGLNPPAFCSEKMLHMLSDQELLAELSVEGGIEARLLADQSFVQMFLPIVRADLKITETYNQIERSYQPLPCPISILVGVDDRLALVQKMPSWENFTTRSCDLHTFPGGHFYLLKYMPQVVEVINTKLSRKSLMGD